MPDEDHENTHMVLQGPAGAILIDCVGRPLTNLKKIGIAFNDLHDIILTHFHPDHVGSVPNLLITSWLLGRREPLRLYGLAHCMERIEDLMTMYHWEEWRGFYPVAFHYVPEREDVLVFENEDFRITSSPVRHYVPVIGLRIEVKETGFVLAYSSDTVPCPEVVRLSKDADLLIHEAAGFEPLGHAAAYQAGEMATKAGAKRLGLIHYPVWEADTSHLVPDAESTFDGPVFLCEDFMEIPLKPEE
ncbi:MAG: MBL fold metallo-hydrolase [Chloroflexi bacterium]|nr:MBL fold metallo-hydrolase [Chloroflexota bacterium]